MTGEIPEEVGCLACLPELWLGFTSGRKKDIRPLRCQEGGESRRVVGDRRDGGNGGSLT